MLVTLDARMAGLPGIGRFVTGLWGGLRSADADVIGLWPHARPQQWLGAHAYEPAGEHVRVRGRPFLPLEQFTLPLALRRTRARIHHAPHLNVPYATRTPTVLTVHDLIAYHDPTKARSRAAGAYYRTAFPLAVRKATIVVAVSRYTADQVRETFGINGGRLRVVEAGLDHARWRPQPAEAVAEVLRELALPTEYLLYVGTAKPHKNVATLARAVGALEIPLVCAGPTPAELAAVGVDPSRVHALGRVPDRVLPALYSGARLLALPSLVEGCGLTPLEAMACGTPVVVSDGGALPDTVGDAGIIVPACDVDAWTDALRRVNADDTLRNELRERGFAHAARRDWRLCARQYVEVYRAAAEMQ